MSAYEKGDRIQIRPTMSPNGRYAGLLGEVGTIIEIGSTYFDQNTIKKIKLDNGKILTSVGYSSIMKDSGPKMTSKERIEQAIERKKEELVKLQEKLNFLNETKQTEFNGNEFKAYQALTLIEEGDLTKAQRAKEIAKLFNK